MYHIYYKGHFSVKNRVCLVYKYIIAFVNIISGQGGVRTYRQNDGLEHLRQAQILIRIFKQIVILHGRTAPKNFKNQIYTEKHNLYQLAWTF